MPEKSSVEYFNEATELEKEQIDRSQDIGKLCEERHRLERELMDIKEVIRKAKQLASEKNRLIRITNNRGWTAKSGGL